MRKYKILALDNEPLVLKTLEGILLRAGYECILTSDGDTAIKKALLDPPDLFIIDRMMPGKDGLTVAKEIKKKARLSQIPILMLTGMCSEEDKVSALESVIDDYYCKPFSPVELIAKIKAILRHSTRIRDSNPTTHLPGGNALEDEIKRRISSNEIFALMHIDIDNFKAYADTYGFNSANKMIRLCGKILGNTVESSSDNDAFLSHIGGDDFIIVTNINEYESLAWRIIDAFDSHVYTCFKKEDVEKGTFKSTDRKGKDKEFPVTTLSIGIISNENRAFRDASEMGKVLVRAKNKAKRTVGKSNFFFLDLASQQTGTAEDTRQ